MAQKIGHDFWRWVLAVSKQGFMVARFCAGLGNHEQRILKDNMFVGPIPLKEGYGRVERLVVQEVERVLHCRQRFPDRRGVDNRFTCAHGLKVELLFRAEREPAGDILHGQYAHIPQCVRFIANTGQVVDRIFGQVRVAQFRAGAAAGFCACKGRIWRLTQRDFPGSLALKGNFIPTGGHLGGNFFHREKARQIELMAMLVAFIDVKQVNIPQRDLGFEQ